MAGKIVYVMMREKSLQFTPPDHYYDITLFLFTRVIKIDQGI